MSGRRSADRRIALTRGGRAALLLAACLYAATLTASAPMLYLAISFLVGLVAANALLAWRAAGGITVLRDAPTHVCERKDFAVRLQVTNGTRFARFAVSIRDGAPWEPTPIFVSMIRARESRWVSYRGRVSRRGVYTLQEAAIESAYPLGLVTVRRRVRVASEIIAYPFYYEIPHEMVPASSTSAGAEVSAPLTSGTGGDFYGIREYRSGDSLRHVHWPSTARLGELMVKQFEHDVRTDVAIFLESSAAAIVGPADDSTLETAVRAAASVAFHVLNRNFPAALVTATPASPSVVSVRSQGDPTPIFDALARVAPSTAYDSQAFLRDAHRAEPHAGMVVIILHDVTQEAIEEALAIRCGGKEVYLFLLDRGSFLEPPSTSPADDDEVGAALDYALARGVRAAWLRRGEDIAGVVRRSLRGIEHRRFATPAKAGR